ncbi:HsdM family class I SAM-dependent methyltransferase [Neoroseomonas soli]|uniref:N-6 DNA methylase n=1 Tax=Neoroseomonas soli TaxID=1081025 RepID=A0A9X9WYL7_9PROT|nr:N-6 DNA methylase [Neoroseomonas soli]
MQHLLRLPHNSGHSALLVQIAGIACQVILNAAKTPYLVVLVAEGTATPEHEDGLKAVMADHPTVAVGVLIAEKVKFIRKNFRTQDFEYVSRIEPAGQIAPSFILAPPTDREPAARGLKPLADRLENILFEVHSALRDLDGLHAPDALDEVCKLLYAKVSDEEAGARRGEYRFQRARYLSAEECAAEVRRLYLDAVESDRTVFANRIPGYERSRGVFREPITLSSSAIVRAVELLQHYDISGSPVDIKGRAFQNVLLPAIRSGMGQYFTPKQVISFVVQAMNPKVGDLIMDPFCGSGHFLTEALDHVRRTRAAEDKAFHEFAFTRLHGIEKSDRMVRVAMTDMRLHGDGHSNIRCVDALLPFENYPDLHEGSFDLIMTNPPFGSDLPAEAIAQLGPFEIGQGRRGTLPLEIVGLERCVQLLRPGGRLAIVLPDSVLGNRSTSYARDWLWSTTRVRGIVSLPIETFTPFGANIKTSVLIVRKMEHGERAEADYPVFMADITNVGHDAAGRTIQGSELTVAAEAFVQFINEEGW